jgi:hypothetical protein
MNAITIPADPRTASPPIRAIAACLPRLAELVSICDEAGFRPEALIGAGLLESLAELVAAETAPNSPDHDSAQLLLMTYAEAEA